MRLFWANYETSNVNEHNMVKNPNRQEADQLGVVLGCTEKQLHLSGQSGTWTRDLRFFKSGALTTRPRCSCSWKNQIILSTGRTSISSRGKDQHSIQGED